MGSGLLYMGWCCADCTPCYENVPHNTKPCIIKPTVWDL
jgi:hypothetical protein